MNERLSATTGTTGTIGPRPPTVRARLSAGSSAACESCSPAGCRRCRPRRGRDRRRVADRGHARYDRPVLVAVRAVHYGAASAAIAVGMLAGAGWPRTAVWLRPPSVAVTLRERGFAQRWRLRSRPTAASRQTRSGAGRQVRSRDVVRMAVEVLAGSVVPQGGPRVGAPSRDLYPTRAFTPSRPVRAPAGWPLDGVGAPGRR